MIASQSQVDNRKALKRPLPVFLLATAFFIILGVTSWVGLVYWLITTNDVVASMSSNANTFWATLSTVGVLRPLLIMFASVLLFRTSRGLYARDIAAARWAQIVSAWLAVIFAGAAGLLAYQAYRSTIIRDDLFINMAQAAVPALIGFGATLLLSLVIRASMRHFLGDEDILSKQTRQAWNLLTPLIIVLLLIAISPLE